MSSALDYRGKQVLITGGLGFIGSNLAVRLAEAGAAVTVVDSLVEGCGANRFNLAPVQDAVNVVQCDIGEPESFAAILRQAAIVFNLAGEISHSRSMEDPERDLQLNTRSQLRFLLACRAHCPGARIVYASTRQVYGQPEYLPVDERHPIQPIDFNGVHKYAATQYHLLLARRGDLDCAVIRLSNVYGPRMALSLPQQGFLGVYLRRRLDGEPILVYGDGTQLRDPIFVDDVVDAFLDLGAAPALRARVFNLGGPDALALREIAEIVAGAGHAGMVRQLPFPEHLAKIDIGGYHSDSSLFRDEWGTVPRVSFREGVRRTLAYYEQHRAHYLRVPPTAAAPPLLPVPVPLPT